jgi:hypothetical protein
LADDAHAVDNPDDMDHALAVCTAMGEDLVVLDPPGLRQAVIDRSQRVLGLYSGSLRACLTK